MNISEIREKYPQYNDLSDAQLAQSFHKKFYSDIPYHEFAAKIGVNLPEASLGEKALVGLGRGFVDAGEGIKQLGLSAGEKLGIVPEGRTAQYTKDADEERQFYGNTPVGQSGVGAAARFVGNTLPYALTPGGVAGGLGARIASGAAAGAGIGALQYVPEGNSRGLNTALGGVVGGAIPAAIAGVKGAYDLSKKGKDLIALNLGANEQVAEQVLRGVDPAIAAKTKAAADRLDFAITPAEASGSPIAAKAQGKLGTSQAGEEALAAFGDKRKIQGKEIIQNYLDQISPNKDVAAPAIRETARALQSAKENKILISEKKRIDKLLNTISPVRKNVDADLRNVAQDIIENKAAELQKAAKPFYSSAAADTVSDETLRELIKNPRFAKSFGSAISDPDYLTALKGTSPNKTQAKNLITSGVDNLIQDAQKVRDKGRIQTLLSAKKNLTKDITHPDVQFAIGQLRQDPIFRAKMAGVNPNSVEFLDLVKKNMDEAREGAYLQGKKFKASLITDTKNQLTGQLDEISPNYAQARAIYGEGAKPLEELKNSQLGKIANLDDTQLKNSSKIIFDPAQTNLKVLGNIRDQMIQKNPSVWRNMIRNEIESKLEAAGQDYSGNLFSKRIIGNTRDFDQLYEAAKGIPDVRKQLTSLRSYFKNTSENLANLGKTDLARLANLDDTQLKNVSHTIFDPAQTDIKVFRNLRDQIQKANPESWRQIVRNEMERRLDTVKGERSPQKFYNQVLSKDRDFNQFLTALKGDPNAQRKLIDMRRTWKNLINPYSVKAAAQLAKSSLDVDRSTGQLVLTAAKNFLGGQYDKAAIKLITSNQWDKEFAAINKIKAEPVKIQRLNDLFGRIAAQQATSPNNEDIQNAH